MSRDERTYGSISEKYDEWVEIEASRPKPVHTYPPPLTGPYAPEPEPTSEMSKMVAAVIGMGTGLALLALAAFSFTVAADWAAVGRDGAQVGYTLVAFFLLVAGLGGILATWNHNFRVLNRPGPHY